MCACVWYVQNIFTSSMTLLVCTSSTHCVLCTELGRYFAPHSSNPCNFSSSKYIFSPSAFSYLLLLIFLFLLRFLLLFFVHRMLKLSLVLIVVQCVPVNIICFHRDPNFYVLQVSFFILKPAPFLPPNLSYSCELLLKRDVYSLHIA